MAGLPKTFERGNGAEVVVSMQADREEHEKGGENGEHEEGLAAEVHETAVNLLYLLILLHLAGVLFETRRSGRKVILAMVPGHR